VFVELPILNYSDAYAFPSETGNGFHPSSDKIRDVIQRNFIPMATALAGAARVNADYTVTLEVRPAGGFNSGTLDSFQPNDKKVFKFRAYQPQ
jgi:hypothetical protein